MNLFIEKNQQYKIPFGGDKWILDYDNDLWIICESLDFAILSYDIFADGF